MKRYSKGLAGAIAGAIMAVLPALFGDGPVDVLGLKEHLGVLADAAITAAVGAFAVYIAPKNAENDDA